MTYDVVSYNGEADILEIRLNILDQFVDQFIICEANETFSGISKPLSFEQQKERFKQWLPKIKYYIIDDYPNDKELILLADTSPNVPKGQHWWRREFYQKESIRKALKGLKNEDIVYISDVDEIWKPQMIGNGIYKLNQLMYSYYLNNRVDEIWHKAFVTKYKNIKNECLNHLRTLYYESITLPDGGWHFTNMGGAESIRRKLESYGHQEFNTPEVKDKIQERIDKNEDFIGRDKKLWREDGQLPQYLLDNREKWKHLFNDPLVSVVIPLYNYGHYLAETIQSVLNQTYKNFEIICVDDCSSDNSIEVASRYPVRIIRHEINRGLAETRNTGIRAARGEYILPLDSDDWIHKDFIRYTLALNTDIASTGQRQFGEQNNVYIPKEEPTFEDFKIGNQINACSLYKKKVWETIGGYESNKVFEDWQFWLKATHAGFKVKVVPYPLFFYRIHADSMLQKIGQDHKAIGEKIIKDLGYE